MATASAAMQLDVCDNPPLLSPCMCLPNSSLESLFIPQILVSFHFLILSQLFKFNHPIQLTIGFW